MLCGSLIAAFVGLIAASDQAGGMGENIALLVLIVTLGPLFGLAGGKLAEKFFGFNEAEEYVANKSGKWSKQIAITSIATTLAGLSISTFAGRPFSQFSPELQAGWFVSLAFSFLTLALLSKGVGAILAPMGDIDSKIDERERAIRNTALARSYIIITAVVFFAMIFPGVGERFFSRDSLIFVFLAVALLPAWVNSLRKS